MEPSAAEILAIALASRTSLRRAALMLLAVDGALNGGRRAEPEDDAAVSCASAGRKPRDD